MNPSQFRWFNFDRRARAESDAALEAEARKARIERYRSADELDRQQFAFDRALDQFAGEQPTRVVLDGYLDAVTA